MLQSSDGLTLLVGWIGGQYPQQAVQVKMMKGLPGQHEVAAVGGVECSTEDTDAHEDSISRFLLDLSGQDLRMRPSSTMFLSERQYVRFKAGGFKANEIKRPAYE